MDCLSSSSPKVYRKVRDRTSVVKKMGGVFLEDFQLKDSSPLQSGSLKIFCNVTAADKLQPKAQSGSETQ